MSSIFISYRRSDSAGHAGRLMDFLSQRYGKERVFMDVVAIAPGEDFIDAIQQVVESCDVFTVLIGRSWVDAQDESGNRRLENKEDILRMELVEALSRSDVRVIPALVGGATMPSARDLPKEMKKLARRNAIELSETRWVYDCHQLATAIDTALERTASNRTQAAKSPDIEQSANNAQVEPEGVQADPFEVLRDQEAALGLTPLAGTATPDLIPLVRPISLEVGSDLVEIISGSEEGSLSAEFIRLLDDMRNELFSTFGVKVPGVTIRGVDSEFPANSYVIALNEIPMVSDTLRPKYFLCPHSPGELSRHNIKGEPTVTPDTKEPATWVRKIDRRAVEKAGYHLWSYLEYPARHLQSVLRKKLGNFIGIQETHDLIAEKAPDCLEPMKELNKLSQFRDVLRILLEELVPIIDIEGIATVFIEGDRQAIGIIETIARVRMLPTIRPHLSGNHEGNSLLRLDDDFTKRVADGLVYKDGDAILLLEPDNSKRLLEAVRRKIQAKKDAVLVVENPTLRRAVRKLMDLDFPTLPVLARKELISALKKKRGSTVSVS